jgi:viroplasmin and RNaseH domain-containing protein
MKIEEIINNLLNHEITKDDAITQLQEIVDGFRQKQAIEYKIESHGFSVHDNDSVLQLRNKYGYSKVPKWANKATKVDVIFIP